MADGESERDRMAERCDRTASLREIQKKERMLLELKAEYKERAQVLESLKARAKELNNMAGIDESQKDYEDLFLKLEDSNHAMEAAEREYEQFLQKEADIARLKEKYAELTERKKDLQRQVQGRSVYKDFMERMLKITKSENVQDVEALADYVDRLLHFREQLYQKEIKLRDEVDQQKKALVTLEDQHNLLVKQKKNRLSQLQTELERTRSEYTTLVPDPGSQSSIRAKARSNSVE